MKKTVQQLEAEARETQALARRRQEIVDRYTPDTAERLSRAYHGSYYTNPEVTAALGVSDIPVDYKQVHINSAVQAAKYKEQLKDRRALAAGATPDENPNLPYTLVDLLRMDPQELAVRSDKAPAWWDQVDPINPENGLNWRNIPVPSEIKDAKELLDLQETQVIKLFLSKTEDEWYAIPGMIAKGTYDTKGNRIPGSFDAYADLGAKFPHLRSMWDARAAFGDGPKPWSPEAISSNLISSFQEGMARSISTLQLPFKALGFAAPDHIGPAGGVEVAGINLPSRISLKGAGEIAKGGVRAATTGFVAAAQASKSTFEYAITNRGPLSALGVASVPVEPDSLQKFNQLVVEGNILSQIAKNAIAGEKIDIGTGFFPEGKIAEEARKAHDAALPTVNGQTWTLGRATISPLVQEGYIDQNGYVASLISGIVDGTFTTVTDPGLFMGDPVQALMRRFNLTEKAALTVLDDGIIKDALLDKWRKERQAAGASTTPKDVIDLPYYSAREVGEEAPRFAGILPEGTVIPEEVQQYVDQVVEDTVRNLPLAAMDNPPSPNLPILSDRNSIKRRLGVIDPNGETPRFVPREIDAMPYTREGQVTLEKLGSFNNVGELYDHFLGSIPPGLAVAIQDVVDTARAAGKQVDLKEIHRVLKDGVYSGDPLYNIREVPGVYKKWVNQTGPAIAQWTSGVTRQLARMPKSTFFSFEDPIASVRDANRLMVVMKVPKADRHAMLSALMNAVAKGEVSRRFELSKQFTKTIIAPQLRQKGIPESVIDEVADWAGKTDDVQQWSFTAVGGGYPTPWLADAEVLRSTDLQQKGFMMVAPEKFREVVLAVTNTYQAFAPFRDEAAMIANGVSPENAKRIARTVNFMLSDKKFSWLEKIQANYLKPVALGAPLPVRMVTRILPDEILRIAITESLDESALKALGAYGHVNINTFGVEIKNAKEIQKLMPKLEHYDDLVAKIKSAEAAGDTATAERLRKQLDKFVAKNGTKQQMQAQIDLFNDRINEALPGTGRKMAEMSKGLMADQYGDPSVLNYVRQMPKSVQKDVQIGANGQQIIDPKSQRNRNWVTGTARDLVQMSDTPEYREVARAMLAGGRDAVEQLPNRFLYGDLKPVFEDIWAKMLRTQGAKGMSSITPLTSIEGQMVWIRTILEDILTRTASDPVAIGVVATGKLGRNPVLDKNAWKVKTVRSVNVYEPTIEFKTWVQDNLLQNPNSPEFAPFAAEVAQDAVQAKDRLFTKAFALYRDASAKYARGPYKDYQKWKRIRELIPAMSPKEAAKMAEALDKSDAPKWLRDSIRDEVQFAAGTATRKQVEVLGEMYGNQKVDQLLFDSSNRSYVGYRHSLTLAFIDAWVEQWSVWMRAMAEQPSALEKVRVGQQALENTGVLYTDEDTGEQGVAIPFSKEVYSLFGLNAQERIRTKNLSLLGSAVPGFFGVGAMVMDSILPNNQAFQSLRATVFPFGDPQTRSKIADYLVPAWGQGFIAAAASRGGKTGTDFFDNLQQLASTETNDSIRATTANAVLTNIASNRRGVPLTADEREAIIDDAVAKTDYLLAIKALGRIFLPGASYTKYFTEIGAENVTQGQVLDDFSKMQEEARKNGGSYTDAVVALFDKYGEGAWVFLAGATQAAPGLQVTKEYAKWQSANPGLVDKYPLVAGWLGPQTGEYDPAAYRAQSSSGLRKPRDIEQRQERALNNLAWAQYNHFKDQLVDIGAKQGFTEQQVKRSENFKALVKQKSDELKTQFPMWNPAATSGELERELVNQIRQIEKMVKDPAVLKLDGGKALQQYWDFRKRSIDLATSQDPSLANDSWRKAKNAGAMRAQLTRIGEQLVDTYPDFAPLWENILSREFEPAEIGM